MSQMRTRKSQLQYTDFGYNPECKLKNPWGLNEVLLPLARMNEETYWFIILTLKAPEMKIVEFAHSVDPV